MIGFGCAAVVIVAALWFGYTSTKGNHLAPEGRIGKVRVQRVDDNVSFAVLDFNVKNDSDRDFLVRRVTVSVARPDGNEDGQKVAARDLEDALKSYAELGGQFNPVLKDRDIIPAHGELDRMVGARFDVAAERLQDKKWTLHVEDATGAEFTFTK